MGRLVKAFPKDSDGQNVSSDEARILRDTGEAVARIQQELRVKADQQARVHHGRAVREPDAAQPPGFDERSATDSDRQRLGRDASSEVSGVKSQSRQPHSVSDETQYESPDVLRLFTGGNGEQSWDVEPEPVSSNAELIQKELMEELIQERNRWTERHAMQVRSIEEQARQFAEVDAEIELRERELDRRERELDARDHEIAALVKEQETVQASHDWDTARNELDRLASEVRVHANRASQFEAELAEVRREHAAELDKLREQLSQQDDSRVSRAKSVIDECDQRMAELAAERTAWQEEQSQRREEAARLRLEQRDELRQQREAQLVELKAAQDDFELERATAFESLERERREWDAKVSCDKGELLDLKRTVEEEAERVRGDISREKAEWESCQEKFRAEQRQERERQQEELVVARKRMEELEQLKNEHTSRLETMQEEIESERAAWHRERGQEASILQTERSELETEADRLRTERSLIEMEKQQLTAQLEKLQMDHDESLRQSWRSHQESIQQSEHELTSRQRVMAENLQQQESELAARKQLAEHEIRTARELSSRQIAQDKDRFSQACAMQEADLNRARAELIVRRQQFERERQELAEDSARVRKQAELHRNVVRNTLNQLESQLEVAATSLLSGMSAEAVVAGFAEKFQPSVDMLELPARADEITTDASVDFVETVIVGEDNIGIDGEAEENEPSSTADVVDGAKDVASAPVWEPGKEATLVESNSSMLIRRVDSAAESGGVSGLDKRPHITSQGVAARAAADASAAEIVYDESNREAEWAGTVESRTVDTVCDANTSGQGGDGRRQALESYRSKLCSLQDQLRQLSSQSDGDDNEGESADA